WGGGDVNVNVNRYNNINRNNIRAGRATTLPANSTGWRHDPSHRKGVAYRDAGTRQQYLGQRATPSAAAPDFRGFSGGQGGVSAIGQRCASQLPGQTSRGQGAGSAGGQRLGGQGALQGGTGQGLRSGQGQLGGAGAGSYGGGQRQQSNAFGDF